MIYGDKYKGMDTLLARDYVNPNELKPMHSQLHLCESLFGDWNANVCLLMQDPADVDSLKKFHEKTGRSILSHSPFAPTNKRLVEWLSKLEMYRQIDIEGSHANSCGLYYANAIWFLKREGGMSGALKQRKLVIEKSTEMLIDTFRQLKKLELIIAFGEVAYAALREMFHLDRTWPQARQSESLIQVRMGERSFLIGVTNHPKARGVPNALMEERLLNIFKQWHGYV
jgi:hypothetical protein